jgi:dihydroorotate dehydrogenase
MSIKNLKIPFYDPLKSYEDNCKDGPFGGFTDGIVYKERGEPQYDFFGKKVYLPFGIPAGPIPNANFCKGAFDKGFDLIMYKTVRTQAKTCNKFPNIVPVQIEGDLTIEKARNGLVIDSDFKDPIAITNSFGVPSLSPKEWQPDFKKAQKFAKKGQVMIATFQGTNTGDGEEAFIEDWKKGAELIMETNPDIIEMNLSCPNEGTTNLLCHDTNRVVKIATEVRKIVGKTPLLVKMSYFENEDTLIDFIEKLSPILDGFNAINTIAGEIRNAQGEQALPGKGRLISGVCGAPIKWAGINMVKRMAKIRENLNANFKIIGTGGVTNAQDYKDYIAAGADAVMSATGAMWNTDLAKEIKAEVL